ncbi:MAG: hypothetical protein J5379_01525 [Clostridiales bacterium]|nr:hypothetical protein [Clostridiales bacterium]
MIGKKCVRRLGSVILSAAMTLPLLPIVKTSGAGRTYVSSKNDTNTWLDSDNMGFGSEPDSDSSEWKGDYIWYGNYQGSPMKFRLLCPRLSNETKTSMLLNSDRILFYDNFDDNSNVWENSELRSYLNGEFINSSFSSRESANLLEWESESRELKKGYHYQSFVVSEETLALFDHTVAINGDKVSLPDVRDASNTSYSYGIKTGSVVYRQKKDLNGNSASWWLINDVKNSTSKAGVINSDGSIAGCDVTSSGVGVSPKIYVDHNHVIFSTMVKEPDSQGFGAEYKLTMRDEDLSISIPKDQNIVVNGNQVTFPYIISGKNAAKADRISVLILDKYYSYTSSANIVYYDAVDCTVSSSGTATFTFPSDLDITKCGSEYYVYILAEDTAEGSDADHKTDFASQLTKIVLPTQVVNVDLSSGSALCSDECRDLINYAGGLFDFSDYVVGDNEEVSILDIDRDGRFDVFLYGTYDELYMGVFEMSNISGTYSLPSSEINPRGYASVTFKFPSTKPTITKAEPTDTGVQIKWNKVIRYNSYNIYRSDSASGTYSYLASVTGGTLKYVDKSAQGGKTYYYKVRPYTKFDGQTLYGSYSAAAKVTVLPDLKLTVSPKSGVTMTLSWTAVSGAQSYEIYRATSAGGPYTYVKATTGTSTSDTGLHAGTRYYYMVRAKKTVSGTAQYSKYAAGVAVALATPSMESASYKSGKGVTLTWTKASGADRFNVYRYNTSTGKYDYVASVLGGTLTYTDASGKKGDYYKVRAYKRVDGVVYYGGWSNAKAGK